MSTYHGWDREELRKAGEVTREASIVLQTPVEIGPISFTPINHRQESAPNNLRRFSINSDALDDLPKDYTLPEPAVQPPKKRGRKPTVKAAKARSVNLGQVWEYLDEGDSPQQGDPPAPKRRKSAPPKRNKAIKAILKSPEPNQNQDDGNKSVQDSKIYGDIGGTRLFTPPDTASRTRREVGFDAQGKQSQFFRGSMITKPVTNKTKGLERPSGPKTIIKHPGWTTTENTVKSSPIVPSKTTLEKLACFRYGSTPVTRALVLPEVEPPSQIPAHTSVQPGVTASSHLSVPVLPDYGVLASDSHFKNTSCSAVDVVDAAPRDHPLQRCDKPSAETYLAVTPDAYERQVDQNATAVEHCQTFAKENSLYSLPDATKKGSDGVQDIVETHQLEPYDSLNVPAIPRPLHVSGCGQAYDEYADEQYAQEEYEGPSNDQPQNYPDFLSNDLNYLPIDDAESLRISTRNDTIGHRPQPQVSNSELPHLQSTESSIPEKTTRDYRTSDEFDDEGIKDEDFLALASDTAVIPETSSTSYTRWEPLQSLSPSKLLPSTPCPVASKINHRLLSAAMIIEDDFSDSDIEDAMLNLSSLRNEVKETKAPPASVAKEYDVDDDSVSEEVYDSTLKFSPLKTHGWENIRDCVCAECDGKKCRLCANDDGHENLLTEAEDWSFIRTDDGNQDRGDPLVEEASPARVDTPARPHTQGESHSSPDSMIVVTPPGPQSSPKDSLLSRAVRLDDSHEYLPLQAFARPGFPPLIRDRSPILGLSGQTVLRTCFRIGEMLKEGGRCNAVDQDALIELFARVTFSSRDSGTVRQHFQFADLFHDRPPFPNGILENFKTSGLVESESRALLEAGEEHMARALGRLRKDTKNSCWVLSILSIRTTDWEEIRWTKRIVSANQTKSEKGIVAPKL